MTQRPLAAFLLAILLAVPVFAQDPKLPDARVFDKLVVDSLRDVHNRGADLYNTKKQFEGAYRVYEGALVTIRPLLAHRPQAQKIIDDGFAAAEKEPVMALKAFKLHEAIEAVRTHLKNPDAATKKEPDPKPKDKTEPKPKDKTEPKPKDKKDVKPSAGGKAKGSKTRISGGVTFKGQPVKAGEVTLVTLDQAKPRVFTIAIAADGTYAFPELPPGRYVVIVTAPGVPAKYQTTTTSGLVIEVPAGATVQHLDLK